ncbi:MAG: hypothetical protein KBC17_00190 [Candidatus Pacebacteria bacterium]|nr:hypothetical protein [Candidatus Paceibacterota bacterium]
MQTRKHVPEIILTAIHIAEQNEIEQLLVTASQMAGVDIRKMSSEIGIHPDKVIRHLLSIVRKSQKGISFNDLRISSVNATTLEPTDDKLDSRFLEYFKDASNAKLAYLQEAFETNDPRVAMLENACDLLRSVASGPRQVYYATKYAFSFVETISEARKVYGLISENYQLSEKYAIKYIAKYFYCKTKAEA